MKNTDKDEIHFLLICVDPFHLWLDFLIAKMTVSGETPVLLLVFRKSRRVAYTKQPRVLAARGW